MGKDYLSLSDTEFDKWFKFMNQYVNQKCSGSEPEWTHIPAAVRTAMDNVYASWSTAYARTIGPHTPVDTEAKNDMKDEAKKAIRPFVNQYLRFPPVTDEDRTAMGIPNHDATRTPIGKPKTMPVFNIEVKGIRRLIVSFHDEGTARRAIPDGMNGAIISWGIFDASPKDPKKLPHTELATRSPHILEFEEEQRGKTAYLAMQWQNETGKRGDYTEIQSAIVP
ncbi:MAG: hypothetical protein LBP19_05505 [Treponema sp.]|nr:hypothetical protein [Treponema sp.]